VAPHRAAPFDLEERTLRALREREATRVRVAIWVIAIALIAVAVQTLLYTPTSASDVSFGANLF
jgi:hypothetical protein